MRYTPNTKYKGWPCLYVSTGCAYEDMTGTEFKAKLPKGIKPDGYATMQIMNEFIRQQLPVQKKVYYKRGERFKLRDFLAENDQAAVVCVYGHSIYVKGKDYWSFFKNWNDDVVCIWYIGREGRNAGHEV